MIGSLSAKEIRSLLKKSHVFRSASFLVYYTPEQELRVGFSIRRVFGKAVERNRLKRMVRSSFKNNNLCSLHVLIKVVSKINLCNNLNKELNLFCDYALGKVDSNYVNLNLKNINK